MKPKRERVINHRRTSEFVQKGKSRPFRGPLGKDARIALYRKRAAENRDIFTGEAYAFA